MNKKKIIFLILLLIILFLGIFSFVFMKNKKNSKDNIIPLVNVDKVSMGAVQNELKVKGEILFSDSVIIYADSDYEVEDLYVKLNDNIKKNETLIKFKNTTKEKLERKLKEAKLNLEIAEVALANAKVPITDIDIEKEKLSITRAEQSIKDAEFNLKQANINVEQQKKLLENSKKNLEDTQLLFDVGAVTKETLDNAKAEIDKLEDALYITNYQKQQTEQNVESSKLNLKMAIEQFEDLKIKHDSNKNTNKNNIKQQEIIVEKSKLEVRELENELKAFSKVLTSPLNGVITALNTNKSDIIPKGKNIMEISSTDNYKIILNVGERHINKIKVGQKVNIEGNFLKEEVLTGKISKISYMTKNFKEGSINNTSGEKTVSVEVKLDKEEKYPLLKAGFSIDGNIVTESKEKVITIPISSIVIDKNDETFVYVVKEDNTLEKRKVELGLFSNMYVEAKGVEEGEVIVSELLSELQDGMKVKTNLSTSNKGDN